MKFAELVDVLIASEIARVIAEANQTPVEDVDDAAFVASETIGEVLDKLIILNIRTWHLEDEKAHATTDAELGAIQRKLQSCFRSKRPRLVAALNEMLKMAVLQGRLGLLDHEVVKSYKGDEIQGA